MAKLVAASPEFSSKIASILQENGITDPIEQVYSSAASELAGLHFASLPHFVEVSFKGKEKRLQLFSKKTITFPTPELAKLGECLTQKEGTFLKNIITDINDFVFKTSGRQEFLRPHFPKTYYFDDEEALMENLYKEGYGMHDKDKKQGHAAAMAVVRALARLHGASWAWTCDLGGEDKVKEKYPILFDDILECKGGFDTFEKLLGMNIRTMAVLVKNLEDDSVDKKKVIDKYGKYTDPESIVMADVLAKLKASSHLRGISHSDCWTNNMMFTPDHTSVKLLDFQIVRFNCPLIDLTEYLSTSVTPSVLKEWKTLFNAYYQTLKETVEITGQKFPITLNDVIEDFASKLEVGLAKGTYFIIAKEAQEAYNVHESESGMDPDAMMSHISKWIHSNPKKAKQLAKKCIEVVNALVAIQPYTE